MQFPPADTWDQRISFMKMVQMRQREFLYCSQMWAIEQAIVHSYDLAFLTQLAGQRLNLSLCPAGLGNSFGQGQSLVPSAGNPQKKNGSPVPAGQRGQRPLKVYFFLLPKGRGIEDEAAADGYHRRELAEDEAIPGNEQP